MAWDVRVGYEEEKGRGRRGRVGNIGIYIYIYIKDFTARKSCR